MAVEIRRHPGPRRYLAKKITHQTVKLCSRYVDLKALSVGEGLCHSYVTRIISGERSNPSSDYLFRVANGLGMTVNDLVDAIRDAKEEKRAKWQSRLD